MDRLRIRPKAGRTRRCAGTAQRSAWRMRPHRPPSRSGGVLIADRGFAGLLGIAGTLGDPPSSRRAPGAGAGEKVLASCLGAGRGEN